MKLSDFVEALDNQISIFRGFHIDLKVRVRISLWILLLAPSSLLQKIFILLFGKLGGLFYILTFKHDNKGTYQKWFLQLDIHKSFFVQTFC